MEKNKVIEYSIVTPAYNEADKITSTLTQYVSFMREFSDSFEVIIVDDGSTDNTVEIVKEYALENPEIRLICNPHRGKGPTVTTGILEAKGQYIYMSDADLSSPMSELKKLSVWMREHDYDIVIASREGVGAKRVDEPFLRHLMGRVFNMIVQIVALPGINDSQCGFKLFKSHVAKDIFKRLKIYNPNIIEKKPFLGAFDVEVLYIARLLKYSIKEVPVTWTYVNTTRIRHVTDSLKMTRDVIRIRIAGMLGQYTANTITALK